MMRRMLAEATSTFLAGPPALHEGPARDRWRAARDWIVSRERSDLFAFENVCEWLALEPELVRTRLREERRRHAA